MGVKGKVGILIAVCIASAFFWFSNKEPYSVERVVESVWDQYEVQSTEVGEAGEIGHTSYVLRIDVYNKDDIPKVEKYLEDKLSKDDLTKYEIEVFSNKGITY